MRKKGRHQMLPNKAIATCNECLPHGSLPKTASIERLAMAIYGIRARKRAESPKRKGPAIVTGPSIACSQPLVTTGGGGALPLPT